MRATGQARGNTPLDEEVMIHFDAYNIHLDTPTSCDKYPGQC